MNKGVSRSQPRHPLARTIAAAGFLFVAAGPAAAAGPHTARISADLADHLQNNSQTIRVIVHGEKAEMDALAARYNLRIARPLKSGAVFLVNAGQLGALRQDETVDHLSGDIRIQSLFDASAAASIGADQVWAGTGDLEPLSGRGVSVAVIDSGIDTRHNALRNRVIATKDFTGGTGIDRYGHGTHVAGIIAGQVGQTADTREFRGIASGAYLLNLRVLGDDGSGTASDVIEALDWSIEHKAEYNIKVINMSIGTPVLQPYRDDPLCEAVERAVKAGITVVVAAGNNGSTKDGKLVYGSISSPANSPYALTVGAIDTHGTAERSDDTLAAYSSKGPTKYDLIIKPDVAAPGSHIASAESVDSYLSKTHPERHVSGSGQNSYFQLSGTSMSAGVVSGAVALLLEEQSRLKPANAKAVLQLTSSFMPAAGMLGAGAGMVNVVAAVELAQGNEFATTSIAGEDVAAGGLFTSSTSATSSRPVTAFVRRHSRVRSNEIIWGDQIIWGTSISWGTSEGDSIVWETQIIWGTSIVWGTSDGDSIVWGTAELLRGTSIVWGTSSDGDSIVWGMADTL